MTVALANSDDELTMMKKGTSGWKWSIKTEEGLENVRFPRDDEVHTANDARLNTEDKEIIDITLSDDDEEGPSKRIKVKFLNGFVCKCKNTSVPNATWIITSATITRGSSNARNVDKSSLIWCIYQTHLERKHKATVPGASLDAVCVDDILRPELAFINIDMSFIPMLIQPVDSVILVFTHIPRRFDNYFVWFYLGWIVNCFDS
ncbi:hypothetical protein Ocin01_18471 [Orchesella cincta]|uniref:Uncharacterized protein n=1 Tax=Orchesella cincta TaxID=48709 RepID=A0A1D2M5M1_ORCCI|nr:hypothetical protein Ocin01_18471 [Orchesella cincta]